MIIRIIGNFDYTLISLTLSQINLILILKNLILIRLVLEVI